MLNLTPYFCRSNYQRSIATLLSKAEYRLHKELNLAPMLAKLNECHNFVQSLIANVDSPDELKKGYAAHYSNTIQISMNEDKSLSIEDDAINNPISATPAGMTIENVQ